jgi:hypothetical protein
VPFLDSCQHSAGLETYLATAAVELERPLIGGGGHPDKMTLILRGGVAVAAKAGGDALQLRRAKREVAAWRLACELDFHGLVPATVLREMPAALGSALWVEGSAQVLWPRFSTAGSKGLDAEDCEDAVSWPIAVFDTLAANSDRNEHNWGVIDEEPHIVLIDHGHAFEAPSTDSPFALLHRDRAVPEPLLARIVAFADDPAESKMRGLLTDQELAGVFSRARQIASKGMLRI